ncbi:MAG: hypothetical protein AUG51_20870 [Acidobacteria bacterium 13_1_20CM_3_53_8]|nr:MAG: hypothetical protein AUH05_06565 [Ktedonobacter sp. 13_2_20CM_53_11]OLE51876.1 MAG: hypothetical protein AUG51_20870 [Acidobacteria bacterium 13_1_20CM_3_53_8]
MLKSAKAINTWDTLIKATDDSIAELVMNMHQDPKHATHYQQNITILMLRKQEAIIRKKMGEVDATRKVYQELIEELEENARQLASDAAFYAVSPTKAYSTRILSRAKSMHEALTEIEDTVRESNATEERDYVD